MPIRIYDIAKKHGLESKVVLAKAKELGITTAIVPSSALDKITAEFLEGQLGNVVTPQRVQVSESPIKVVHEPAPASIPPRTPPRVQMRILSAEFHALAKRVAAGESEFVIEISEDEKGVPLRLKLGVEKSNASGLSSQPSPPREITASTRDLLREAYFRAKRGSTEEWVNLATFGAALKYIDENFDSEQFGERSLGSLLRRAALDIFELRADDGKPPVYHVRLRPASESFVPARDAHVFNNTLVASTTEKRIERSSAVPVTRGKIHNLRVGFGFIAPDDISPNRFFHATDIVGCTIFDLRPGDPVEFVPGVNERGPCATTVRRAA